MVALNFIQLKIVLMKKKDICWLFCVSCSVFLSNVEKNNDLTYIT